MNSRAQTYSTGEAVDISHRFNGEQAKPTTQPEPKRVRLHNITSAEEFIARQNEAARQPKGTR